MSSFDLPIGRINADYFQSPHVDATLDPAPAVIDVFTRAKASIHFAIYSLTHAGIADSLVAAHQRGVEVVGVADASELKTSTSKIHRLLDAGIDVKAWGSAYRLMHDKVLVVDTGHQTHVGLGSFNWTTQAEKSNVEVLLIAPRHASVTAPRTRADRTDRLAAHERGTAI
jgi:phosphatidylserine/phosphatidylglycerophosphate/cardiolipin synthase-like enzyme